MKSAVIFKQNLRQIRDMIKEKIELLENECKKIDFVLAHIDDAEVVFESNIAILNSPTLKKLLSKTFGKVSKKNTIEDLSDIRSFLGRDLEFLTINLRSVQNIINAYENDQAKDVIESLPFLAAVLSIFKDDPDVPAEALTECFGMAVHVNYRALINKKDKKVINNSKETLVLGDYFNRNGTFKFNEDLQTFRETIKLLLSCDLSNEIINYVSNGKLKALEEDMVRLLEESNEKIKETSPVDVEPVIEEDPVLIEDLEELKKYYKNGDLVSVPEDLEEFKNLLKRCKLEDKEIRYIFNLIAENDKDIDWALVSLDINELNILNEAKNILNNLRYNDPDYYVTVELLNSLSVLCELLNSELSEEEREYLLEEKQEILLGLQQFCAKHKKQELISQNNLLFLKDNRDVPYIENDIEQMDKSFRKSTISLLTKIKTDNKSNFRKVLGYNEAFYTVYDVFNGRCHIFFVEIDAGIYVVLEADLIKDGYKDVFVRLERELKQIKEMESLVKCSDTRNSLLCEHEVLKNSLNNTLEDTLMRSRKNMV